MIQRNRERGIKIESAAGLQADKRKPPRRFLPFERFRIVFFSRICLFGDTLYGGASAPPLVIYTRCRAILV